MTLPAPRLDDRDFQGLVDDAKRFIQQRCPDWSDHNVSDPGVTLVETFAWMTDVLLYRLNRVPDRHYVKFLELIGVTLFPPTTAEADVTFRLSSPQDTTVHVPEGTVVSTPRSAAAPPVAFTTDAPLSIVPARSDFIGSMIDGSTLRDHTPGMGMGVAFDCFDETPKVDDALYIGFDRPAPSNTVLVRFQCNVGGHGIDPLDPPIAWEAWDGNRWASCFVEQDGTGGLNLSGDVDLHLPSTHAECEVGGRTQAWLRCRVVEAGERRPYRSSPKILSVDAAVIGGTVEAAHGEQINNETLGVAEGVAGQRFQVLHVPVALTADPPVLQVRRDEDEDWEDYTLVPNFADTDPDEQNFTMDPRTGEVRLGPAVRLQDGSVHQYGAIPAKGATVRLVSYRTGGGSEGNVAAGAITQLRSSIPYIASVRNFRAATGGVDAESLDEARERGPLLLRTRNRAVTAEDYEILAREAAPEAARVRCVLIEEGADAGCLRLLVVPDAAEENGRIEFRQLVPDNDTGERIQRYLDERRVVGTRLRIEPPSYVGVKVEASLRARPNADPDRLRDEARGALYRYFNPLTGGPDGTGWPFGRPVQLGEVFGVLQKVRGIDLVENAVILRANPVTGELSEPEDRIDLGSTNLVFSYDHVVEVA